MFRTVLHEIDSGVAHITLNRPDKRNALNREMVEELKQAIAASAADTVRVIVITGSGKDFCSGADLAALEKVATAGVLENLADAQALADLFLAMRRCPKPVVAAVRGSALAGGCGLATACDIVLAAESAQFGYPEVNIGFVPAMVMALLRRCVSEKTAFELATTGEIISAARAHEIGMVQHVYADDEFTREVAGYAARLASKPASAVALTKALLYQIDGINFQAGLAAGAQTNALARMTEECRAGVRRFLDR